MEYVIIPAAALAASMLTLFSGFGLGTLLLPVFAIYYPLDVSVAATAVVHLLNNIAKLGLLGKRADFKIVYQFGLPALAAAFAGAWILENAVASKPIYQYSISSHEYKITIVKLIIGGLMILFSILETVPKFKNYAFDRRYLAAGGALSGFFGGLSGHQGALRSMFLLKLQLQKEAYIATGVVIAVLVDAARLCIYSPHAMDHFERMRASGAVVLAAACAAAVIGSVAGARLLQKTTLTFLQTVVAILLAVIGAGLAAGVLGS